MRIPSILLADVAATIAIATHASATTYTVDQSIGAAGHVTGTIETDGAIGSLVSSDITGWDLLVAGAGASTVLTDLNSGVYVQGAGTTASASAISFDYDAADYSFLLFQAGGFGGGDTYWCNASSLGTCFQGASTVPESYNSASLQKEARSGTQVIASAGIAAPEPAAWMTLVIGFGLIGATMRRRSTTWRRSGQLC